MHYLSTARTLGKGGGRSAPPQGRALIFFTALFLCAAYQGAAQQISRFAVYSAKGEKFSISYEGQTRVYRPEPVPSGGITLQKKDRIQTGEDSVVELRSYPPGITILVADKSSVIFENVAENGSYHIIAMVFGRVRIINTTGNQTVIVRAGRSLIEAGPGDINIDYALYPWADGQSNRTLVVSTLKNGAFVTVPPAGVDRMNLEKKFDKKKKNEEERLLPENSQVQMKEGETFYIDPIMSIVEKRALYHGLQPYWARKGYWKQKPPADRYAAGYSPALSEARPPERPPAPPPARRNKAAETGASRALAETMPYTGVNPVLPQASSPKKKRKTGLKVLGVSAGILLIGGGAVMQYGMPSLAPSLVEDPQMKDTLYVAGFVPMGLGLITIIGSLIQ